MSIPFVLSDRVITSLLARRRDWIVDIYTRGRIRGTLSNPGKKGCHAPADPPSNSSTGVSVTVVSLLASSVLASLLGSCDAPQPMVVC